MKPIGPQDRPKVIALGVLSVIMLAFFLKTILGAISNGGNPANAKVVVAGAPPEPAPAPAATSPAPGSPTATTLPGSPGKPGSPVLATQIGDFGGPADPFRHVLPDPASLNVSVPAPPLRIVRNSNQRLTGKIIGIGPVNPGAPGPEPVEEPVLRLDGVVADHDRFAMVTCQGRTDMYRIGGRIARVFRLIGLSEAGALFEGPHGRFRLEVGDEHRPILDPVPTIEPKASSHSGTSEIAQNTGLPLPAPDLQTQLRQH